MALKNIEKLSIRRTVHNRLCDIFDLLDRLEDDVNVYPVDKRTIAKDSIKCARNRIFALDDMLELEALEKKVNNNVNN